jgi:hypothetical protein
LSGLQSSKADGIMHQEFVPQEKFQSVFLYITCSATSIENEMLCSIVFMVSKKYYVLVCAGISGHKLHDYYSYLLYSPRSSPLWLFSVPRTQVSIPGE